jgi:hypothetical protein
MGIWSVFTFLLFYFKDVIGVAEPAQVLPVLLGIGAVLAVPASIIGVRLAARHGLVRITQITSGSWRSAHSTSRSSHSTQVLR